jgi:hypothetical protein
MGLQHQNLLPDLPDYETAVNDPRYAKKPPLENAPTSATGNPGNPVLAASSIAVPPPPPYSVAVAAEPLNFNFPVPTSEHTISEDQTQQAAPVNNEQVTNEVVDVDISSAPVPVSIQSQPQSSPANEIPVSVSQQIEVAPAISSVSIDVQHQ